MKDCTLCTELQAKQTHEFRQYFYDSRIIAMNDSVCIFPTLGCFVKGYLLLASIRHYISLYDCPEQIIRTVKGAINTLREAFRLRLGSGMVFFEHGTVNDYSLSSASVSHFHMHFLPASKPLWKTLHAKFNFVFHEFSDILQIKNIISSNGITAYLLFGDLDGHIYLIDCSNNRYPSQFLRRVMYEQLLGTSERNAWDWKVCPYYDTMKETFELFRGVVL